MLSQDFVLSLLQASITGAGLVLAVYALIIPIASKLFKSRAETLTELKEEITRISKRIDTKDTKATRNSIARLAEISEEMSSKIPFPTYLSWGIFLTFLGYIASTLMCIQWLVNPNAPISEHIDRSLPTVFVLSTIIFLVVGTASIKDIYSVMKREFEETKKEIEETKSKVEEAKSKADISVKM